jgi:hypothetical protein
MERRGREWVAAGLLAVFLGVFIGGCAPKVDTRFQAAPPPATGARPDPPNPDKVKRMPSGDRPGG